MVFNNIVYLLEIIAMLLVLIIGTIIIKAKKQKGFFVFLGMTIYILVLLIWATYIIEKPEIEIRNKINIEITDAKKIEVPNAFYHLKNVKSDMQMKDNIDYEKIGQYYAIFEIDTLMGKFSKKVKVNIVDSTKPEIILLGDKEITKPYYEEFVEPGFKAIDKFDGDITEKVKVTKEQISDSKYDIIYEVEDNAGNKKVEKREIVLTDDISPILKLNGRNNIVVPLNDEYIEKGATAVDEFNGDITDRIKISGNVDTSNEGTYPLIYKVKDKSGNEANKKRLVIVKDMQGQTINEDEIGVIYLTFDDGPSTNITPKILDILEERNVEATFFILDYDEEEEQIVKREYEEGHTIGIHGYSHDYSKIYENEEAYMENITKLQEKIKESTGYNATITRFPGGSSNTISKFNKGIMTRLTELVVNNGYKYFDWNVCSEDAVDAKTSEEMYNNVIEGLSKTKTNIVLMHDFGKNTEILDALPRIIDYGIENGYVFEKITEETPMITHRVFN